MNEYRNTAEINIARNAKYHLSIGCLVCGEPVMLDDYEEARLNHGLDIHSKICDKCKEAIIHVRKELKEKDNNGSNI